MTVAMVYAQLMALAEPGWTDVWAGRRFYRDWSRGERSAYHRDLVCAVHPPSHSGARDGGVLKLQCNAVAFGLNGVHLQGRPQSELLYLMLPTR